MERKSYLISYIGHIKRDFSEFWPLIESFSPVTKAGELLIFPWYARRITFGLKQKII